MHHRPSLNGDDDILPEQLSHNNIDHTITAPKFLSSL
jgi:hypothetical protein